MGKRFDQWPVCDRTKAPFGDLKWDVLVDVQGECLPGGVGYLCLKHRDGLTGCIKLGLNCVYRSTLTTAEMASFSQDNFLFFPGFVSVAGATA